MTPPPEDQGSNPLENGEPTQAVVRSHGSDPLGVDPYSARPDAWGPGGPPPLAIEESIDWQRQLGALLRHKWLILAFSLVGVVAGIVVHRSYPEIFVAHGSLWVQRDDVDAMRAGPIRSAGLLESTEWLELLTSYSVLDPVVIEQRLRVVTTDQAHAAVLADMELEEEYAAGAYRLEIDRLATGYTLYSDTGVELDRGRVGSRIGTALGFSLRPDLRPVQGGAVIPFVLLTIRDAADALSQRLEANIDEQGGSFIELELAGNDPVGQATVINSIMERFVTLAGELKNRTLTERVEVLGEQLDRTEIELRESERSLESFRVQTVTYPSERGVTVTAGLQATRDPAFTGFFELRQRANTLRYDRERLARAADEIPTKGVVIEAFEAIEQVGRSSQLSAIFAQLTERRQELRGLRLRYTDEHPPVARLLETIRVIEYETIPSVVRLLIDEMTREELNLENLLASSAEELAQIPPRSIEEARLDRNVEIANTLYSDLRQRFEQASLAAASTIPDVRILDRAVPPDLPNEDSRIMMAIALAMAGLGLGVVLGLILDRFDAKLRDIREVTTNLGFPVLGTIPRAPRGDSKKAVSERNSVVEAFRSLRFNTSFGYGASGPILLSITSPAPEEGKTTVAVNLALAYGELGKRTLLIDADTRRGDAHEVFQLRRNPGLVTVLSGDATVEEVTQSVREDLDVITSGERSARSPEMINSADMVNLLADVKGRYDVIIVDSPPIGAGSDAFVLGAMCGSTILVVRNDQTDLTYAGVMVEPLQRLPVRLLGVVLNDVKPGGRAGPNRYYANYLPNYEASDELAKIG